MQEASGPSRRFVRRLSALEPMRAARLIIPLRCLLCCVVLSVTARAQVPYREGEVRNGSILTGVVRASGDKTAPDVFQTTKDPKVCGSRKTCPRWRVGRSGGVAGAVVYLEDVAAGKPMAKPSCQTLAQTRCEYSPHIMIVPLGSELAIVNNDPILHNVHAYEAAEAPRSIFNIAQPVRGQRTVIKTKQLSQPGFVSAACDAGHPWMDATIVVASHPYYAITDTNGAFRFEDVPPGTYTVVLWHEGVRIVKKELEGEKVKKYIYEEPYVVRKSVVVPPQSAVKEEFALTLR